MAIRRLARGYEADPDTGVLAGQRSEERAFLDTAFLMGGILTARQYFRKDHEIVQLATKIYNRIDFQWMLNGDPLLLSHGWRPESGFIKSGWNRYSEHNIIQLLGIGSPTTPMRPEAWYAWDRNPNEYGAAGLARNA